MAGFVSKIGFFCSRDERPDAATAENLCKTARFTQIRGRFRVILRQAQEPPGMTEVKPGGLAFQPLEEGVGAGAGDGEVGGGGDAGGQGEP